MAASFSIVIPAYNEENGIGPTLEKLRTLPGSPRIIVVNDGSTDGTAAVVKRFPDVSLLSHPVSGGYGQSLKTGIRHASTDIIVITDADAAAPTHLRLSRQELAAFVLGTRSKSMADALAQLDRVLDRSHLLPPGAVESVMKGMKVGGDAEH